MAIGKVIHKYGSFFPDFDEIFYKIKYEIYRGDWEMLFFLQIPNIKKTDILEYFEDHFLGSTLQDGCEFNDTCFPLFFKEDENLKNSIKPNYNSEYVSIIGQLFLAGYVEFGMCGLQNKEENLLSNQGDKYQAWIYFRDNFFYTEAYCRDIMEVKELYKDMSDDDYVYSSWNTPQYWDRYRFWVARTEKGTKYLREILEPRIYNKYKDLEVEIDDKGSVLRWIGEINR
ncbi:hypothetical protein I9R69_04660 [Campylobacter coli]|nr:hypothetical protein [Campylobacter coli]MBX1958111.1 hypothetical protein [Campylobacter coli]